MGRGCAACACACLALALLASGAAAQQLTPFLGRNRPPKGGVDVYISPIVDHLVAVDDAGYKFTAVLYILLTWQDPRAATAVNESTTAAFDSSYNNGNGCEYPCTTIYAWNRNAEGINLCCDSLWLPHFEFVNVVGFSQDRVVRYGVRLGDNDSVAWWQHVQGEFYTEMQFRAFPFDKQYLSVQMQYGNKYPSDPVTIIPSATGTQLYNPQTGDELSGWTLKGVQMRTFNLADKNLIKAGGSTYSAPGDPFPINSANESAPHFQGLLWQNGVEVLIEVDRISLYYIILAIVPVVINTWLALLVFSVNPRHLDTRLGIVVTLFLSLTALQFVLATGLPSSATIIPTQQLIIVAYCILGLIGIASIGTFWMVQLHHTDERRRRLQQAQRQFARRWQTATQSMGLAAAAISAMQQQAAQQRGAAAATNGSVSSLSLRQRSAAKQQEQQQQPDALRLSFAQAAAAATAAGAPQPPPQQPALQASPFESPKQGVGVYAAGAGSLESSGGEDSEAGSHNSFESASPRHGGLRVDEAAAPVAAADEEDGGARLSQPPRWLRVACCGRAGRRRGRQSGDGAAGAEPPPKEKPGWLKLQWYKWRLMKEEMRRSQDYAMYHALAIDRAIFWSTLIGFNIAVILIFAIGSTYETSPTVN